MFHSKAALHSRMAEGLRVWLPRYNDISSKNPLQVFVFGAHDLYTPGHWTLGKRLSTSGTSLVAFEGPLRLLFKLYAWTLHVVPV